MPAIDDGSTKLSLVDYHIPYRLGHLDGLVWAARVRAEGLKLRDHVHRVDSRGPCRRPPIVSVRLGVQDLGINRTVNLSDLTNSMIETGLMSIRSLLGFLGISPKEGRDEWRTSNLQKLDWRIQALGLDQPNEGDFDRVLLERHSGGWSFFGPVLSRCHLAASKAIAHLTCDSRGSSLLDDLEPGAVAVMTLFEELVYAPLEKDPPSWFKEVEWRDFRVWTLGEEPCFLAPSPVGYFESRSSTEGGF